MTLTLEKQSEILEAFRENFEGEMGKIPGGQGLLVEVFQVDLSKKRSDPYVEMFGCSSGENAILAKYSPANPAYPVIADDEVSKAAADECNLFSLLSPKLFPSEFCGLPVYYFGAAKPVPLPESLWQDIHLSRNRNRATGEYR